MSLTKAEAKKLYAEKFWESLTFYERAKFQLVDEPRLCMPFDVFHEAVEKSLRRLVYTHEFGLNLDGLRRELLHIGPKPTLKEIVELIPVEKRIIMEIPE